MWERVSDPSSRAKLGYWLSSDFLLNCVIPKARALSSGPRDLAETS